MTIALLTHDSRWKGHAATVRKAARAAIKAKKLDAASLTILLTTDVEMQALNKQYRGKDKPTNVLSFPDGEADETGAVHLGDIALAYETIAREATEQQKTFKAHLTHLVIHGVLHLLGYDHEHPSEAKAMESLEIKLLTAMGIANPY